MHILKSLSFIFFFLLCPTICNAQGAKERDIVTTYYVSSSQGDDSNDGLSEMSPLKHISALKQKEYVCVKLKRGDVFYEQIQGFGGSIIESYGNGDKPVICGYKVIIDASSWIYDMAKDLWRLDLNKLESFAGMLQGDQPNYLMNNVGFIYDPTSDMVWGHLVGSIEDLKENGEFFVSTFESGETEKKSGYRYLWWKREIPPLSYKYLCFPMAVVGIKRMFSCTIRDLAITGFCFGITNCHHSIIDNCKIDLIGGAVQANAKKWVRYGNGIEFWWNAKNNIVRNCEISRTFDCGVTIQGQGEMTTSPENIHITGNRFYHCRQAFEFWLNPDNGFKPEYKNCSFTNNICVMMGDNEFSSPEERDVCLLSYDLTMKPIKIEKNMFWGAPLYYGIHYPEGITHNFVFLYEGQCIINYYDKTKTPLFANGKKDIKAFRHNNKDDSSIILLKRGKRSSLRKEKALIDALSWEKIELHLN